MTRRSRRAGAGSPSSRWTAGPGSRSCSAIPVRGAALRTAARAAALRDAAAELRTLATDVRALASEPDRLRGRLRHGLADVGARAALRAVPADVLVEAFRDELDARSPVHRWIRRPFRGLAAALGRGRPEAAGLVQPAPARGAELHGGRGHRRRAPRRRAAAGRGARPRARGVAGGRARRARRSPRRSACRRSPRSRPRVRWSRTPRSWRTGRSCSRAAASWCASTCPAASRRTPSRRWRRWCTRCRRARRRWSRWPPAASGTTRWCGSGRCSPPRCWSASWISSGRGCAPRWCGPGPRSTVARSDARSRRASSPRSWHGSTRRSTPPSAPPATFSAGAEQLEGGDA